MKTFNKTFLPEEIIYNGDKYVLNSQISSAMNLNRTNPKTIVETLKKQDRKAVLVQVLSNKLKGKSDLYGNTYKPTQWIFTNDKNI